MTGTIHKLGVLIAALATFVLGHSLHAQTLSNLRAYSLPITKDTLRIDTLSIVAETFEISLLGTKVDSSKWELHWFKAELIWKDTILPSQSVDLKYRVFNFNFPIKVQNKDPRIIIPNPESKYKPYIYRPKNEGTPDYYSGNLSKTGSITRGISLGNNQDLSVNSSLDLQLNGSLNKKIKVRAAITDNNIPIQPDGNTQQLQDFDKVFIELSTSNSKLIAGDFDLVKPSGYFINYNKKAQGISFKTGNKLQKSSKTNAYEVSASAAISKGKFSRNNFAATEGNQGPYKLRGKEGEPFIIVLSGSEKVYIDGKLMTRGTNNDYVINYNSSEIIFTSRQPMTKDKRIVIDFQYSDKNYVRSVITSGFDQKVGNINWFVHAYSEQDSKNQPLQQDLTKEDKLSLYQAGDDFLSAFVSGVDSAGYSNDFVQYSMRDSLGFDSIFVYSNHPDSAYYRVIFSQVGLGNGDYLEDRFVAGGKTYRWVAPQMENGEWIHRGNYSPLRLLKAPEKQQMLAAGMEWNITKNVVISLETALSNTDKNTFSPLHDSDNMGFGIKSTITRKKKVFSPKKSWYFLSKIGLEKTDKKFVAIERFRGIEFQRDWNLGNRRVTASDYYLGLLELADTTGKKIGLEWAQYYLPAGNEIGSYQGRKAALEAKIAMPTIGIATKTSFLNSQGEKATFFLRNKTDIYKKIGKVKFGLKDDIEDNRFFRNDSLFTNSHQFYFGEVYLQNTDSLTSGFRVFYNQRLDRSSDTIQFRDVAYARQYGGSIDWKENPKNHLKITLSNRELKIINPLYIDATPEKTLLGRLDHTAKNKKSSIVLTSYYEITSGLEPKQEFIYIEVPAGQGLYVWNDYNGNNIKELNEFEVAQFDYDANYIRSFIPSDTYQKVFGNFYSQILQLTPQKSWNSKKGWKKILTHFATITSYRSERKTTFEKAEKRFNPFLDQVADTSLVTLNKSLRNTIYFNRTHPVFGADYTFSENKNKSLLTNGFDSRLLSRHELKLRWTLPKNLTFRASNAIENKKSVSDFLTGRNYHIVSYKTSPEILWQPNNKGSFKTMINYTQKTNFRGESTTTLEDEKAVIMDLGVEGKINSLGKGTVQVNFNWIAITYNGLGNDNLSYEMLEGLHQGVNLTWGINFQRKVAKNIQISLNYQGRKSEINRAIHVGGMSARAFF